MDFVIKTQNGTKYPLIEGVDSAISSLLIHINKKRQFELLKPILQSLILDKWNIDITEYENDKIVYRDYIEDNPPDLPYEEVLQFGNIISGGEQTGYLYSKKLDCIVIFDMFDKDPDVCVGVDEFYNILIKWEQFLDRHHFIRNELI